MDTTSQRMARQRLRMLAHARAGCAVKHDDVGCCAGVGPQAGCQCSACLPPGMPGLCGAGQVCTCTFQAPSWLIRPASWTAQSRQSKAGAYLLDQERHGCLHPLLCCSWGSLAAWGSRPDLWQSVACSNARNLVVCADAAAVAAAADSRPKGGRCLQGCQREQSLAVSEGACASLPQGPLMDKWWGSEASPVHLQAGQNAAGCRVRAHIPGPITEPTGPQQRCIQPDAT